MLEVERKRHKGVALQLALLVQPPDLVLVGQQPPHPHGVLIEDVAVVVWGDVHSLDQQLAVLNIDPAVFQVHASRARRLLTSVPFSSTPVSSASRTKYSWRFPVCGNRLGCRTLFGRCHSAPPFYRFGIVTLVYHIFVDFQGHFLKKL